MILVEKLKEKKKTNNARKEKLSSTVEMKLSISATVYETYKEVF